MPSLFEYSHSFVPLLTLNHTLRLTAMGKEEGILSISCVCIVAIVYLGCMEEIFVFKLPLFPLWEPHSDIDSSKDELVCPVPNFCNCFGFI